MKGLHGSRSVSFHKISSSARCSDGVVCSASSMLEVGRGAELGIRGGLRSQWQWVCAEGSFPLAGPAVAACVLSLLSQIDVGIRERTVGPKGRKRGTEGSLTETSSSTYRLNLYIFLYPPSRP
jgi:hypothetical protein